jgi:uncharacterized membrane protein
MAFIMEPKDNPEEFSKAHTKSRMIMSSGILILIIVIIGLTIGKPEIAGNVIGTTTNSNLKMFFYSVIILFVSSFIMGVLVGNVFKKK